MYGPCTTFLLESTSQHVFLSNPDFQESPPYEDIPWRHGLWSDLRALYQTINDAVLIQSMWAHWKPGAGHRSGGPRQKCEHKPIRVGKKLSAISNLQDYPARSGRIGHNIIIRSPNENHFHLLSEMLIESLECRQGTDLGKLQLFPFVWVDIATYINQAFFWLLWYVTYASWNVTYASGNINR